MAVGLGAMVGVGDTGTAVGEAAGVGEDAGVATGVGEVLGVADGDDAGFGVGVGEGFAAITIPGNPRKRQAIKPSKRDAVWLLFFEEIFTIILSS